MMKIQKVNQNIMFNAGLTKQMRADIKNCNVKEIENFFAKKDINTNFGNNNIIAWCCLKCFQIISAFNKRYKMNLGVPNGIFAENFQKLNAVEEESLGIANFAPTYLYKDSDVIVPEKTIFFNSNYDWTGMDSMSDMCFEKGLSSTNFFLETFLHEFMHVIHEDNLINKLGGEKLILFLDKLNNLKTIEKFQNDYAKALSQICHYAASHPIEAVACDLSKRGINSINRENLGINRNIFDSSPYCKKLYSNTKKGSKTDFVLRSLWNGKFE